MAPPLLGGSAKRAPLASTRMNFPPLPERYRVSSLNKPLTKNEPWPLRESNFETSSNNGQHIDNLVFFILQGKPWSAQFQADLPHLRSWSYPLGDLSDNPDFNFLSGQTGTCPIITESHRRRKYHHLIQPGCALNAERPSLGESSLNSRICTVQKTAD
jgi:hypothetical protein